VVTLSDEEAAALRRALEIFLPELGFDVARIDRARDRHELAHVEEVLRRLRNRLEQEDERRPSPRI
jgi:hypothetical protein